MKKTIAIILALASQVALAGQHCDVWEYARLKDSTAGELVAHACASSKAADENQALMFKLLGELGADPRRAEEVGKAEMACKDQVKVTKSVFLQKTGKAITAEDCAAK